MASLHNHIELFLVIHLSFKYIPRRPSSCALRIVLLIAEGSCADTVVATQTYSFIQIISAYTACQAHHAAEIGSVSLLSAGITEVSYHAWLLF